MKLLRKRVNQIQNKQETKMATEKDIQKKSMILKTI